MDESDVYKKYKRTTFPRPWDLSDEDLQKLEELADLLGCKRAEAARSALRHALAVQGMKS